MVSTAPVLSSAEFETLVIDVVTREGRPVTVTDIHRAIPKALRPASKALGATVAALVRGRRLFRVGRRYAGAPDRTLHDRVIRLVADEALSAAQIAKKLRVSAGRVREVVGELVAGGELHAYPRQQRVARYAAHAPTAADLLRPELERLLAAAAKLGISEHDARSALRELVGAAAEPRTADPIVAAMLELNPQAGGGALVYVPHLRTALSGSFRDKPSFDRAVLGLLARGTIQLQSHPTPSLLGPAEREAMIEDGRGGYYSAIGLR